MGLIGLSLIVASVVYILVRPPLWFRQWRLIAPEAAPSASKPKSQPPQLQVEAEVKVEDEPESPSTPKATPSPSLMPPPQFPSLNSAQRASSSALAPPPTHSSKPRRPSRKVILAPGRSPLDWARISSSSADLRNLPPQTPFLRVTPSLLRQRNGRGGRDAWMAIGGRVYNVSPYAEFHPGGVPELMRGAGRDGTKLFGEVHPWVNYETMLNACLVGMLVDEEESEMDKMD